MPSWDLDSTSDPNLASARSLLAAARFAGQKHARQKRKGADGEPYINHLLEVAHLVAMSLEQADTNLLMAALLHDTIEDTATTKQEIEDCFGADVAGLVTEVTDDKSLPKAERKRLQVENAPHKSTRAQILKLADKISNLRGILFSPPSDWDYERKKEYFAWAKRVVDGLAEPNPMLKAEFEKTLQQFDKLVRP